MQLNQQQRDCFETFGYLVLPGLLSDEIGWIIDEFEAVFAGRGVVHDGSKRSTVVPFIDQREKLCTLLDNPKVLGLISGLLGDDFNYVGGDGNFYTGDTAWHSDGWHDIGKFIKVALYLDPVTSTSGCLRVIPGTHKVEIKEWNARKARNSEELWGIAQHEVPAIALESKPGDVVAFNHNLMHSSFGGNARRRMFTLNCSQRATNEAEIEDLERYVAAHARFWLEHMHSDTMRDTASPQRQVHLEQVMAHEAHLPALSAKARAEAAEPARG
jgi:ectoine hydroxylase-related dioxygenase (phytanoyl-CoA dioxygenase family)